MATRCSQTCHGKTVSRQRSTGTAQGQHRRGTFVDPELRTGRGVETDDAVILSLDNDHGTVGGRRSQHFAGDASAPLFFTGRGVHGNHFTLEGADHHQSVAHADCTGNGQVEILLPDHVASQTVQRHDFARDVSRIDAVAINGRHEHVVSLTLTVANGTAPLLVQNHFFFEVGQLGRRQFLFAVAAATRGQNGQSQQCCMFPTNHVTHPLSPDRRASFAGHPLLRLRTEQIWPFGMQHTPRRYDPAVPAGHP